MAQVKICEKAVLTSKAHVQTCLAAGIWQVSSYHVVNQLRANTESGECNSSLVRSSQQTYTQRGAEKGAQRERERESGM